MQGSKYIEQGMQKGIQQEKEKFMHSVAQEYIEQGKEREKLEIAKSMLRDSEPIEKIIKWTRLSASAIEQLEKKL
jgi:hypothetical protein